MIPDYLLTQIREGQAVLFLGSGASLEAKDDSGNGPPTAKALGGMLSTKFLGGKYADAPLNQIGEYAISEADLLTVQEFLRGIFEPFKPTVEHLLIPTFRWHGLCTTNYDLLVEEGYRGVATPAQDLAVLIDNHDRISDRLRDSTSVPYLKLHGCITRQNNPECPLILSTDQYISHKYGRDRLFNSFKDWGIEHPIVFVGHSLHDQDIRAIMLELNALGDNRPRYYFVAPNVDDIQTRFWESKYKVTPISATFVEFFKELDSQLSSKFRGLIPTITDDAKEFQITERFAVREWALTSACKQFLKTDVTYVKGISQTESLAPTDFYKGLNKGWSAIEQNLDVRRRLSDNILSDHFLIEETQDRDDVKLIVIKAHAGAGKSIVLRRIAWDAAKEFNYLCLWLNSHGVISSTAIQELLTLCKEHIYLFVDNAADRVREITNLIRQIGDLGRLLTIVTAERTNEWNVSCSTLSPFVSNEYTLRYLTKSEVGDLLTLLETHRALGSLTNATPEERRAAFVERAGRQLLVALHEATMGIPFEKIVVDEFNSISPHEAQQLYLTICVLNRLGVPVRANLIARIHGIRYEDFKDRLFHPLEHVVHTKNDLVLRDYLYRTRHPHIAEIVFTRVLTRPEERYDAYTRCLQHLNDAYDVDRKALRRLLRGRSLLDVLASHELIEKVYITAREQIGEDAFLLHQMALYEMHRSNGNLKAACKLLRSAADRSPDDRSIRHSMAEYYLKSADVAKSELEKKRCLKESAAICTSLKNRFEENSYAYHTLVKVGILELRLSIKRNNEPEAHFEKLLKAIEGNLSEGLERFPGDSHLLGAEADFAALLKDSKRAQKAMEKAFVANPRNGLIAIRLAKIHEDKGQHDNSKGILHKAIEANRNDRRLNFAYARLLIDEQDPDHDKIIYHLIRSFVPGDSNYQARLLLGRQYYVAGSFSESKDVFQKLERMRASAEVRNSLHFPLDTEFKGVVTRVEATYCFFERYGSSDWVFARRDNVPNEVWQNLTLNTRVCFKVGFSFRGTSAFDISLER